MASVTLRVIGSGDPFGSGGRNQSAYVVEAGRRRILLDCGAATLPGLKGQGIDPARLDLVLITHLHGDHIAGLPFIYHDYQHGHTPRGVLPVAGPKGLGPRIEEIYRAFFPPKRSTARRFRVRYRLLRAGRPYRPERPEGVEIVPFRVRHQGSGSGFGYRIQWRGRCLVYSGDTGWFDELPERARGAHLFLCECTHRRDGSPKHLSLEQLTAHRSRLEVGRILLTHLGPEMAGRRGIPGFLLARDGMRIRV